MWKALKGIKDSLRPQPPLEVEEACTLLVQHAKDNDIDSMEAILKRNKVDVNDIINAKEKEGDKRTILHICTANGSLKGVKLLLKYGANLYQGDANMLAPVHAAITCGHPEMVEYFLEHVGAKYCYIADAKGNNPLHIAAIHNRYQEAHAILECLDKKGDPRDLNEMTFKNGDKETPMMVAIKSHATECIAEMLKYPHISRLNSSMNGESILHMVTKTGDAKLTKSLLVAGAYVHANDHLGKTPLHFAVMNNNIDVVKVLLEHDAIVLVRDTKGNTPMHYCTNETICKLLIEHIPKLNNVGFQLTNKAGLLPFQDTDPILFKTLSEDLTLEPLAPKFHVQICSDLHIEFKHKVEITPKAPYLALLGDIGLCVQPAYREFLLEQANKFEKVFVLLGNHEFYRFNAESTIATAEDICNSHPNLIFMNKKSVLIDGVRVLGCTLWSFIRPEQKDSVDMSLSDYRVINVGVNPPEITPLEVTPEWKERQTHLGARRLNTDDTHGWHLAHREWLEKEIAQAKTKGERVVIFTHHSPVYGYGDSSVDYLSSTCRSAFSTDLTPMFGEPVVAWCYGHTHWYNDITLNGTRVISNPHGYPHAGKDAEERGYDPHFVVSI